VLALAVLLGISSLILSARTAGPAHVRLALAGWMLAQAVALYALVRGLRAVRQARHGAAPSSVLRRREDGLLYLASGVGGALALAVFAPTAAVRGIDLAIALIGLVLLLAAVRAALLYTLRR
jgi:hypothetical protein